MAPQRGAWSAVWHWLVSDGGPGPLDGPRDERIDWLRAIPFIGLHAACLGVFLVGFSWAALGA